MDNRQYVSSATSVEYIFVFVPCSIISVLLLLIPLSLFHRLCSLLLIPSAKRSLPLLPCRETELLLQSSLEETQHDVIQPDGTQRNRSCHRLI